MVSKFRALFAVFVAASVSTWIANRNHQIKIEALKESISQLKIDAHMEGWKSGWDQATTNPSVVTESYKKLFLKHQ